MTSASARSSCSSGGAEFKPHLRGSLEPSPSQQQTASCCPPEGSWGKFLTQQRHAGPSATDFRECRHCA